MERDPLSVLSRGNVLGLPPIPPTSRGTVTSDDFAVVLGFKPTSFSSFSPPEDEMDRLNRIIFYQTLNCRFPEAYQLLVWSRFCASHLLATVEKFLDPPITFFDFRLPADEMMLNNAYFAMIASVKHTPYLAKYLRSTKPAAKNNKILLKVLAERFLVLAPDWDDYMVETPIGRPPGYYVSISTTVLQLIFTLHLPYLFKPRERDAVLPPKIRDQLIPWLETWSKTQKDNQLGEIAIWSLGIFRGEEQPIEKANRMWRMFRGWDECGLANCGKTENLKACSKCQTVRYCSPEHQKAHWSLLELGHKQYCFKTEY